MDAVKSFNAELSSLYEVKPPISKAKMTALTRGAIKAIKFYKHVVQSVEKFILKCKPEYKVPGLYVIDSIVRQSRHQFGSDKDVFAPRFAKNMKQTFANLFQCPPEDKSKVIRVLNLWQKNQVFAPDVIQPLFDLADPNHPIHREIAASQQSSNGALNASLLLSSLNKNSPAGRTPTKTPQDVPNLDPNMLAQLQQLQRLLMRQQSSSTPQGAGSFDGGQQLTPSGQPVKFDKKLLDFDYGSDDEDDKNPSPAINSSQANMSGVPSGIDSVKAILSNPEVLRHLQTLQQYQSGATVTQPLTVQALQQQQHLSTQMDLEEKMRKLREIKQEEEFVRHLAQTVPNLPFASECDLKPTPPHQYKHDPAYVLPSNFDMTQPPPGYSLKQTGNITGYSQMPQGSPLLDEINNESEIEFVDENNTNGVVINLDETGSMSPQSGHDDDRYDRSNRRRLRSRSKDRNRRSRSRDRKDRSRRSLSRSRSRSRKRGRRSRSRDREREREREQDRERKKRGLPPIKKEHLSVCTTTLWVGHLSKLVHAEDLSDTFGEFGDIVSIDLIPPRGCAFIVMNRRQDATRCLSKLRSHKMQGKAITLAWAPGKGVKGKEWKDYWEVELGVSYIPWSKLKPTTDFELLEEGGMIDEDTMPNWMKNKIEEQRSSQTKPMAGGIPMVPVMDGHAGVLPMSGIHLPGDGLATSNSTAGTTTTVDTSQPPPPQTLTMPPMTIPLVPTFQQLSMMRGTTMPMQLPPGLMGPNVPIGVPPPNLQQSLIQNSMLGFGQTVIPPPPLGQIPMPGGDSKSDNNGMQQRESLLGPAPFGSRIQPLMSSQRSMGGNNQVYNTSGNHDDMDIDMDDDQRDKSSQLPLSEQLLAAIGGNNQLAGQQNSNAIMPLLSSRNVDDRGGHSQRDYDRRDMNDRNSRDRNSDRGRDRDRDRNRRDSRDRNRDRDNRSNDRERDNRRERGNRWSDRDRDRRSSDDRNDKRRNEKSLNERLQEMANESAYPPGRRNTSNPPSLLDLPPLRPDMLDHPNNSNDASFPPTGIPFSQHSPNIHDRMLDADDRGLYDENNFDGPPGPSRGPFMPNDDFDYRRGNDSGPGFDRSFIEEDGRMRGPPPPGPPNADFFGPPPFGSRGIPPMPMLRGPPGPGMSGPEPPFGPRGPIMMSGPRGPPPHMFSGRGGMRGPPGRPPGMWMDGPRGPNFGPPSRGGGFEGPDGPPFFNSGRGGPFEDGPRSGSGRGGSRGSHHDDRRRYRRDDDSDERDYRSRDKRTMSRWGKNDDNGHYSRHDRNDDHYHDKSSKDKNRSESDESKENMSSSEQKQNEDHLSDDIEIIGESEKQCGNTTPLRDEPTDEVCISISDSNDDRLGGVSDNYNSERNSGGDGGDSDFNPDPSSSVTFDSCNRADDIGEQSEMPFSAVVNEEANHAILPEESSSSMVIQPETDEAVEG